LSKHPDPILLPAHAALCERGVVFVGAPHRVAQLTDHDLWMGFFHDVDGNTLALMSEVRGQARGTVGKVG